MSGDGEEHRRASSDSPAVRLRVLLLADGPCRQVALRRLEAAGHHVRTTQCPDAALAAIAEQWPDVVVAESALATSRVVLDALTPHLSAAPLVADVAARSLIALSLNSAAKRHEQLAAVLDALTASSRER